MSVTTIQAEFLPIINSDKDWELVGWVIESIVFWHTSVTGCTDLVSTTFNEKLSG